MDFLDTKIVNTLRKTVNTNQFLNKEPEYQPYFTLICAIMDRVDSCIYYLNKHANYPKKEIDFLFFLMLCCTIKDAYPQFLKTTNQKDNNNESTEFFRETCHRNQICNVKGGKKGEYPTDDEFFKYIRSLIFAHPFKTNQSSVIENGKEQYSPFVLVDRSSFIGNAQKTDIGICVYSNDIKDITHIWIPFKTIKEYTKFNYEKLSKITDWINEQKIILHNRWKKHKVNRLQPIENMLKEAIIICKERKMDYTGDLEDLFTFLTYRISNNKTNQTAITAYRKAITDTIPLICDAVDAIDEETILTIPEKLLFPTELKNVPQSFEYFVRLIQKEDSVMFDSAVKIFIKETKSWGWVDIDLNQMPPEEIQLLVSASCYLQKQISNTSP